MVHFLSQLNPFRNKKSLAITAALLLFGGLAGYFVVSTLQWKMKNATQDVTSNLGGGEVISLKNNETETTFESSTFESTFEFNAIAPKWREKNTTHDNTKVAIRTSDDSKNWTEWMEVEAVPPQKDGTPSDERFVETPIFITGKYFQVKSTLTRDDPSQPSPEVYDIDVNYLDSREPEIRKAAGKVGAIFTKHAKASQNLSIISRQEWGNPDPHGTNFKGTDKFWYPSYAPVRQIFLHHTVSPNYQADPQAVIRGIWEYHANSLGWGDIGYNYLIDHYGTVYEGRAGGDNVVAGHTRNYNKDSMGVAVLGCFENNATCRQLNGGTVTEPTATSMDRLSTLLSFKTKSYEIDPLGQHTFCQGDGSGCLPLWTITAHKDAMQTECNGLLFYGKLPQLRQDTAAKNNQSWAYNAKQISYNSVPIGYLSEKQVTLSFKNTGTATWQNSGNPMTLRTANPRDRSSPFQGSGWLASSIVATLNEPTVAPGQIGSFTFNARFPNSLNDDQIEFFRLVASGITDIPIYYGLWFDHVSEVAWDFGALDGDSAGISGTAGDTGLTPTALTFNGQDHVFYYDRGTGDLRQARRNGSSWQFTTIDGAATSGNGQINAHVGATPSVVIHNNQLHMLYYDATNGDLRYAVSDAAGTSWTLQTLDGNGGANNRISANLGQTPELVSFGGSLQAFYYDATNNNLRHAWTNGSTWNFENLDGDHGAVGRFNVDLGLDPTATVLGSSLQLFYTDRTNGNLRHAWVDATGWHFENLDGDFGAIGRSNADSGHHPAVLDFGGTLQVLYYDATNTNLRHAWANNTGWHFENLDGDAGSVARHTATTGLMPTMATSTDGRLHLLYYESIDQGLGALRYAIADHAGWHFETLDGTGGLPYSRVWGDVGLDPAILPNATGGVNHLYFDRNNGNLRLALPQ